jgi:hypothetical protein
MIFEVKRSLGAFDPTLATTVDTGLQQQLLPLYQHQHQWLWYPNRKSQAKICFGRNLMKLSALAAVVSQAAALSHVCV